MAQRILVVDDDPNIVSFLLECLTLLGFDVRGISDPMTVEGLLKAHGPEVCILDYAMPHRSGADVLKVIKQLDSTIEVIFLTSEDQTLLAVEMMKLGAFDYLVKPVDVQRLQVAVSKALRHRQLILENESYRLNLERLVLERTDELNNALVQLKDVLGQLKNVHDVTLETLAVALDFRDQETCGHSRRVATWTAGIAAEMGITGTELVQIEHGSLLHDIGKLKIPDHILLKRGKLTHDEFEIMRQHARYGYEFLSGIQFLRTAANIVYSHHEKFDGTGYPRGLGGEEIPIGARLFTIVDSVDAMIYDRPYHRGIPFAEAANEVRRCSGTQFDPAHTELALDYLQRHLPAEKILSVDLEMSVSPE